MRLNRNVTCVFVKVVTKKLPKSPKIEKEKNTFPLFLNFQFFAIKVSVPSFGNKTVSLNSGKSCF